MNILAVDDEVASLSLLSKAIQKVLPNEVPKCFVIAEEALAYAKQNPIDVAFINVYLNRGRTDHIKMDICYHR